MGCGENNKLLPLVGLLLIFFVVIEEGAVSLIFLKYINLINFD